MKSLLILFPLVFGSFFAFGQTATFNTLDYLGNKYKRKSQKVLVYYNGLNCCDSNAKGNFIVYWQKDKKVIKTILCDTCKQSEFICTEPKVFDYYNRRKIGSKRGRRRFNINKYQGSTIWLNMFVRYVRIWDGKVLKELGVHSWSMSIGDSEDYIVQKKDFKFLRLIENGK